MTVYDPITYRTLVARPGEVAYKFYSVNKLMQDMAAANLVRLVASVDAPADTTALWLDLNAPEAEGGVTKAYSGGAWVALTRFLFFAHIAAAGGGVTDGNKGDVVVTGGGTVWTIPATLISAFGRTLTVAADASTARTTLGLGTLATQSGTFSGTFSGTSSGTNTGDQTITLSGDATGTGTAAVVTTLATVNASVGSFGLAASVAQFTVNAKGLITAAVNVAISIAVGAITGLGTGIATWLATPTSANLAAAITDETGTGQLVFATSPTLVTPILGTPTSGTLTNATGLPVSTGVSGLAVGVATFLGTPTSANLIAAVTDETGTGSLVFGTSPTLVTPLLGTPTSGVLTNATGLPISTGVSGLAAGAAAFLATPTSANLSALMTDETGSGASVFATSPVLVTPALGTPSSGVLTNATGLPLTTGVTGTLPIANGGTAQTTAILARGSTGLAVENYTGTGDVAYTILATDQTVGTSAAFTAARIWTLPAANAVNKGQRLFLADFFGTVTATNTLTISRAGADTINGGASVIINAGNGAFLLASDGVSKWTAQAIGSSATAGVSSFGGATGAIGVGYGLIMTGATLSVTSNALSNHAFCGGL